MQIEAKVKYREQSKAVVCEADFKVISDSGETLEDIKEITLTNAQDLFRKAYKGKEEYNMHKELVRTPR